MRKKHLFLLSILTLFSLLFAGDESSNEQVNQYDSDELILSEYDIQHYRRKKIIGICLWTIGMSLTHTSVMGTTIDLHRSNGSLGAGQLSPWIIIGGIGGICSKVGVPLAVYHKKKRKIRQAMIL